MKRDKITETDAKKRFLDSMVMNFDRWHDGTGYDLDALDEMTDDEKDCVVDLLAAEPLQRWSNFEALRRINTPRALAAISDALTHPSLQVRIAASRFAENSDGAREAVLAEAMSKAELYSGFAQALDQVEIFHTPRIIEAMLTALLNRGDAEAVNIAGMLFYIHGRAESSFDWGHRPLFLKFKTNDLGQRRRAFTELCGEIGVDPTPYLGGSE